MALKVPFLAFFPPPYFLAPPLPPFPCRADHFRGNKREKERERERLAEELKNGRCLGSPLAREEGEGGGRRDGGYLLSPLETWQE